VKTQPDRVGLGGGCHWCTEAVFQTLRGVVDVAQGFVCAPPPHDSWSEAVIVSFDPELIDLRTLIEVHSRTHASTSHHKMRGKYRSAIYTFNAAQAGLAIAVLGDLQSEFAEPLVTLVLDHADFKPSDERFHNYYATDPERPFCRTYIDPKLQLIRQNYSEFAEPVVAGEGS